MIHFSIDFDGTAEELLDLQDTLAAKGINLIRSCKAGPGLAKVSDVTTKPTAPKSPRATKPRAPKAEGAPRKSGGKKGSVEKAAALGAIGDGCSTTKAVAERLGAKPTAVFRVIKGLVAEGLVTQIGEKRNTIWRLASALS